MAHWEIEEPPQEAIRNAVKTAGWMEDAVVNIVNPLLGKYDIPHLSAGIGISAGKVIITKLGIPGYVAAKAIGNSVNLAAKLAGRQLNKGEILLDKRMADFAYKEALHSDYNVDFTYTQKSDNIISVNNTGKKLRIPRPTKEDTFLN